MERGAGVVGRGGWVGGLVYAHGAWGVSAGWRDMGRGGACVGAGRLANVTLCSSTWRLTISGDGIDVALTVDVVGRKVSSL